MRVQNQVESEYGLKATLDTLYKHSKEGKSFTGLYELIKNEHTIITAIHNIKSNKGSKTAGIDKKVVKYYLQMPREKLIHTIRTAMDNYNPKPVRRHYIPKGKTGKMRPLGIPTIQDRIIQECTRIVIEPILEAKFYPHSYGFRPYRSTHHAIARLASLINVGEYKFAIEGDIKGYFDNINHSLLLRKLHKLGIIDRRVLMVIKKMLKAGAMENNRFEKSSLGSPQGGIISPLLSNVYLNDFDWTVSSWYENTYLSKYYATAKNARRKLRQNGLEPVFLVRYADDWVILTKTKDEAERRLKMLDKYFSHKLRLTLSPDKTIITDLTEKPMSFLGFNIQVDKPRTFTGRTGKLRKRKLTCKVYPNPKKLNEGFREILDKIKTLKKVTCEYQRAVVIEEANSMIIGLSQYYNKSICSKMFSSLDNKLFKVCHYTWKAMFPNQNGGKPNGLTVMAKELSNRPARHEKYTSKCHAVKLEGQWVGVTKFFMTGSDRVVNFNQEMTPFTPQGRDKYDELSKKKRRLHRPPLYEPSSFRLAKHNSLSKKHSLRKYNFEYFMNREYAWNRDKGKCKICDVDILPLEYHCHHIDPNLPLDKINKVSNLASVHRTCHELIHGTQDAGEEKIAKKLSKYRGKLT
ncbi:group II intron reverse transcriptase/maturase [Aneurinibacillus aneurinilyticus]|uniref:group II intron reverse transcriptase/maturase n=1 Tax=Aneurinibacillus aneurinilyticus TaxID=1391 RepID=UPI0023F720F8|nr:group II intron reverse transcriptase/maturase [Aneurinibacillus aneurinilyticus]MCI1693571.1 group II intron reverse transcriptase/maturase [Aneurinibacillus aneurinilyticus]